MYIIFFKCQEAYFDVSFVDHDRTGDLFRNAYKLLKLTVPSLHLYIKGTSFNVLVRYFVVRVGVGGGGISKVFFDIQHKISYADIER